MNVVRHATFLAICVFVLATIEPACDSGGSDNGDTCTPVCSGQDCGDDGCGGNCGTCPAAAPFCNGGLCSSECASDEGCTEPGLFCLNETSLRSCERVEDACYQWGETMTCDDGYICKNGGCVSSNAECGDVVPVVDGMVKNNVADMDFTGEAVNIQLFHKLDIDEWEDGCISRYIMDFSMMGLGCNFHLEMTTGADTALFVTSASLKADSFCPGWSDSDEGEYELVSSDLTLCSTVEVADYMSQSACVPDVILGFSGLLNLLRTSDGKELEVDLSGLEVRGDMTSTGNTELVCPDPCATKECGDDGCNGSCGECQFGWQCGVDDQCFSPCTEKECGDDGYGGSCGDCQDGWQCGVDQLCFDPCTELECGDNGFGLSCGSCPADDPCHDQCQDGQCVPSESPEICDDKDNDCDGETDENLGNISCGLGECDHAAPACLGGEPGSCDPMEGSVAEVCDQLDNDCDGSVDEDVPDCCSPGEMAECSKNEGECEKGTWTCDANGTWGECSGILPVEETCDGKDNDCDGEIDENC